MKNYFITESQLSRLTEKIVNEQSYKPIFNRNINYSDTPATMTAGIIQQQKIQNDLSSALANLQCVPKLFQVPLHLQKKQNKNNFLLKTALGVIGRESDFSSSDRFKYLNPLKTLWAYVGGQTSVGPGQIKPETASQFNLGVSELNTAAGSLQGVYKILNENYNKAISTGYNSSPSTNLKDGTGNAALDMAIVAFNSGPHKIVKYCETSKPTIKRDCALAGTTEKLDDGTEIKITNKYVKNYIPNFKTKRWDGVNISSHGYVKEVANNIKKFSCF